MQKPVPGLSGHCECHVNAIGEIDPKGDLFSATHEMITHREKCSTKQTFKGA